MTEEFATLTPVIAKNPQWIAEFSEYLNSESPFSFAREYLERNPDIAAKTVVGLQGGSKAVGRVAAALAGQAQLRSLGRHRRIAFTASRQKVRQNADVSGGRAGSRSVESTTNSDLKLTIVETEPVLA